MTARLADENYVEILVKARDEAKPDLDDLRAKLDELDRKVADARVKVTDEGDAAKLDRMAARLDELDHKTANPKIRLAGALRAEAEIHVIEASLDNLDRKGDEVAAKGGIAGWLNGTGSIAGAGGAGGPAGIGALAAGFAILAAQIVSILGPLTAAALGLGAFGALALPTLDKVKNAYSGIVAAQKNYQAAVALEKQDPTRANAAAAVLALDKLKVAWKGLSPVTAEFIKGIQGIQSEFSGLAQRIAPQVLKVFDDLLPGIHQLIGDLGPFAQAVAPVLERMAKSFSQFTMSAGFKQFLDSMLKLAGPALAAVGEGLAKVAIAIGKVLLAAAAHGGLESLIRDFRIVADVIKVLGTFLAAFAESSAVRIGEIIQGIKDLIQWAKNLYHWWIDAWDFMTRHLQSAQANISGQIQVVIGWIRSAGSFITRVFTSDIPHAGAVMLAWFASLPGKISSAVSGFGRLLYSAGQALLQGLLGGIESMVGSVIHAAEGIGSSILGGIKHALGIGSPSREGIAIGANLGDSIVLGMTSRLGALSAAGRGLGRAALPAGAYSAGAAGGGGWFEARVVPSGDPLVDALFRQLRIKIRAVGGRGPDSVQRALGGAF